MVFRSNVAGVLVQAMWSRGGIGRTSVRPALAEAHGIFDSFGEGHLVCCAEGVSAASYTLLSLLIVVKSRGIGQIVLAAA